MFHADPRRFLVLLAVTMCRALAVVLYRASVPSSVAHRKMQVYEAAVAEALQGGGISQKERAPLNRLRDSPGIFTADAEALERGLQAHNESRGPE